MLQGPSKTVYAHQPTKKEETSQINLMRNVSASEIVTAEGLSGLSSRRSATKLIPTEDPETTDT
jgi:hypothetical protein